MTSAPITPRASTEDGFTLIEVMLALLVLSIGILALVAAYSSGYLALKRATQVSSATLLADSQMERYRALQYSSIGLNTSCGASCAEDSTYKGDTAYSSTAQVTTCSTTDPTCLPTQTRTGPDGRSYRVDSYVAYSCVTGTLSTSPSVSCSSGQNPVKLVTVVVRNSAGGDWVREQSNFNSLVGT
jgi:type IV pilus modification protein PilV